MRKKFKLILFIVIILLLSKNIFVKQETSKPIDIPTFVEEEKEDWQLILVNKDNPIPKNFSISTTTLDNNQKVDSRIYPSLQEMFDDMRKEGIYPIVASGYRTFEEQEAIMQSRINQYINQGYTKEVATQKAEEWVSIPGTSEHQLGLAVDINADGINSSGKDVYDWLAKNSYKYGFIKRYPEDKIELTGISHEPWHYRYVGVEAAKVIYQQGICLEEYLNNEK